MQDAGLRGDVILILLVRLMGRLPLENSHLVRRMGLYANNSVISLSLKKRIWEEKAAACCIRMLAFTMMKVYLKITNKTKDNDVDNHYSCKCVLLPICKLPISSL